VVLSVMSLASLCVFVFLASVTFQARNAKLTCVFAISSSISLIWSLVAVLLLQRHLSHLLRRRHLAEIILSSRV